MTNFDFERLKASMGTEYRERNQRTLSMMRTHIYVSLMFAIQISSTIAWGSLGHETVAFIAQNFVKYTISYC
jgi:isoprenylcysteine carboxyl methyltransferase (ICMT) family protein YpbQ